MSERCALKAADKDVLVRSRGHGLILVANLSARAKAMTRQLDGTGTPWLSSSFPQQRAVKGSLGLTRT